MEALEKLALIILASIPERLETPILIMINRKKVFTVLGLMFIRFAISLTVTFSVVASGSAPLSYQWQKHNVTGMTNIANATTPRYTTPPTTTSYTGSTLHCLSNHA